MPKRIPATSVPINRSPLRGVGRFVGAMLFLLNLATLLPLGVAMLAPWVSPETWFWPNLLGMVRPHLLLLPLLWGLLWLWRRHWRFLLVNVAVLLLNHNVLPLTYQSNSPNRATSRDIRLLTLNVGAFRYNYDNGKKVVGYLQQLKPDILCLQEFYDARHRRNPRSIRIKDLLKRDLGLVNEAFVELIPRSGYGLLVLSRYPVVGKGAVTHIGQRARNGAMYADLHLFGTTLRIYNLHLESYNFTNAQRRALDAHTGAEENPDTSASHRASLWALAKRLIATWRKQMPQVEAVAQHRARHLGPLCVVGDLNNGPYSHQYQVLATGLVDTFTRKGSGFGRTYSRNRWLPMRIDYVLCSPEMAVSDHQVYETAQVSDHFPLLAVLRFTRPQPAH